MFKRLLITIFICALSHSSFAGVRKIETPHCSNYVIDHDMPLDSTDENIVTKRQTYGLYIDNMKVNFEDQSVTFDLKTAIILGLNKKIIDERIKIKEDHPKFETFINFLNKDLLLFQEICLNRDNEVISYVTSGDSPGNKVTNSK